MQDHERIAIELIAIGFAIAMLKYIGDESRPAWQIILARSILNGFTTLGAGAALLWLPNLSPLAILGLGAFIGALGSQYIEYALKKFIRGKFGGQN